MVDSVSTFIERLRSRLDDEVGEPNASEVLWTEEDLEEYIDEAEQEFVRETRIFKESEDVGIVQIAFAADDRSADISELVLEIESAWWVQTGQTFENPIHKTSVREIRTYRGMNWRNDTSNKPRNYILDEQYGKITLTPFPNVAGTVHLVCDRLPLQKASLSGVFEIPEKFHDRLYSYCMHKAFTKHDVETNEDRKSEHFLNLWESRDLIKARRELKRLKYRSKKSKYGLV